MDGAAGGTDECVRPYTKCVRPYAKCVRPYTSDYLAGVRAAWVVVAGSSSPRKYLGAFELSLRLVAFISGMAV